MISSDNVKAGLMLAAGLGVAYVVYRGYRAASGAAESVAGVVQSVGQGISDGMSYVAALPSKTYESLAAMDARMSATLKTMDWSGAVSGRGSSYKPTPRPVQTAEPPVNEAIMDRWDYYTLGGRGAASGSGSEAERQLSFEDYVKPGFNYWDSQP